MKKTILILLLILIFLTPLYVRTLYEAATQLTNFRDAKVSLQHPKATTACRRALAWHSPLNPYSEAAYHECFEFAASLPHTDPLREETFKEIRRGLLTSRSFISPRDEHDVLLAPVIAELRIINPEPPPITEIGTTNPNYLQQGLSHVAFYCWLGSLLWSIWFGFKADGTVEKTKLLKGLSGATLFYFLWIYILT